MRVSDGEAIIQLSNITGPVTIGNIERDVVSTSPHQLPGTTAKRFPANPSLTAESEPTTTVGPGGQNKTKSKSKGTLTSTSALVTSGAAIVTGAGVLATALRQILRPLLSLNGISSPVLTPRSTVAAIAAVVGTALISGSVAALTSRYRRLKPQPDRSEETNLNIETESEAKAKSLEATSQNSPSTLTAEATKSETTPSPTKKKIERQQQH